MVPPELPGKRRSCQRVLVAIPAQGHREQHMQHAADLVTAFEGPLKGFKLGAAYLWGVAPFRPDDDVFEILGAAADGNRVQLRLRQSSTSAELTVSLFDPGKLKSIEEEIRISNASKIAWGTSREASTDGDAVTMTIDGKAANPVPRGANPALKLVAAPEMFLKK